MMPLTPEELALDVSAKLDETDLAITLLKNSKLDIPDEAIELRTIMRRCLWAERQLAEIDKLRECQDGYEAIRKLFFYKYGHNG